MYSDILQHVVAQHSSLERRHMLYLFNNHSKVEHLQLYVLVECLVHFVIIKVLVWLFMVTGSGAVFSHCPGTDLGLLKAAP